MALTKEEIKNNYPLPSYNYRVLIDGTSIAFSQVSGLNMTFETTTYKESPVDGGAPGPVTMRMPAQHSDVTVTMQKGIVRGKSAPLYDWINGTQLNMVEKKDVSIELCDENGAAVFVWKVINAFPTGLEAPTFDASSNDASIQSLTLMADRVTMEEI
ncbi:phage tail protein [marine bacterium AO1-C]|nr:phage tail protein [marine bacterium AO1-C]